ncbi:PqiC family protein [Roseateles sp. SL47]|uniref:PqiC family protein n=1 Tax=Roseateles sp. SL47 TaxID=2995138 RepID=UPI00227034A7|nr:PqiC family protein [Roseateles sp. SL47]WAC72323.1 PqiC family protein [Roseateles sp. SL47]
MTFTRKPQWLLIPLTTALGLLTACGSAPTTHYYTLTPPPAQMRAVSATPTPWVIDVQPVGVPEALDQPQIVIRQSDSSVLVLEQERWSGPLNQELRSALSAQLSRQLGTQDVAGLSLPTDRDVLRIKVQVRRFEAWPGERVDLTADWTLVQSSDTSRRVNCRTERTETAGAGYAGMVSAQQRLLSSLSQAIAATVSQWPQAQCPAG